MVLVRRSSTSHVILLYLKMKKEFISLSSIFAFSPQKFASEYNVRRSLKRLHSIGLVSCTNECYAITNEGIQQLYLIVKNQPRSIYNNEQ